MKPRRERFWSWGGISLKDRSPAPGTLLRTRGLRAHTARLGCVLFADRRQVGCRSLALIARLGLSGAAIQIYTVTDYGTFSVIFPKEPTPVKPRSSLPMARHELHPPRFR